MAHSSVVTCEPHSYLALSVLCMLTGTSFVCREKIAVIKLKILGDTVQDVSPGRIGTWDLCNPVHT
jgi:hypothetical protein